MSAHRCPSFLQVDILKNVSITIAWKGYLLHFHFFEEVQMKHLSLKSTQLD